MTVYQRGDFFFNFNWKLITLQYCGGFCHAFTWISHGCTCVHHPEHPVPPPSPSHPSGSSQCTSPEHPVSCIEPGLEIYFTYDNIHGSVLFSQIIPPSPSPRVLYYFKNSWPLNNMGLIPGSRRSPWEGNPMGRAAWWATVHGVAKSQIQLSN